MLPLLLINSRASAAYAELLRWLEQQPAARYQIVFLESAPSVDLTAELTRNSHSMEPLVQSPLRTLRLLMRPYATVLVLCVSNDQVITGEAPLRLLGMAVRRRRLVLIGPNATRPWPQDRTTVWWQILREVSALSLTGSLSLLTSLLFITAIVVNDILTRGRVKL